MKKLSHPFSFLSLLMLLPGLGSAEPALIENPEHKVSSAETAWAELVGIKHVHRPEFAYVNNDPDLPNVLIYGDSISMGYTPRVREKLQGKANVYRLHTNGGDSHSFIGKMTALHAAMQEEKLDYPWNFTWDVVHFNVGLHDLKYMAGGKLDSTKGTQVTSVAAYQKNLRLIIPYLQELAPEARLIFATTTPVPEKSTGRKAGDAARYNEAARQVVKEFPGVRINDLYALVKPHQEQWWTRPGNVHFNSRGRSALGDQVAQVISDALPTP